MNTQNNIKYIENVTFFEKHTQKKKPPLLFPEFFFPIQYSEIKDPNTIQQILQQQLWLKELSPERLGTLPQPNPSMKLISGQALENSITEFHYDKEANNLCNMISLL